MTKKGFEQIMRAAGAAAGKVHRDHLHSLVPTSVTVSLDAIELGAIELWIADQPAPKPSLEEAARRLIHDGLVRK